MAAGGFHRFLLSGGLILAAITAVQRAEAASSTEDGLNCTAEALVCLDGDTCTSCVTDYDQTEYEECLTVAVHDIVNSTGASSVSCYYGEAAACCVDEASDNACMDDDAYVEYWQCVTEVFQEVSNCSVSELSCVGISAGGVGNSGAASSRKPSIVVEVFACVFGLAAVLWYA